MQVVELGAVILVVLGFLRVYSLFMSNGYLGPPFVFDVSDTFMDWFNTAYWAHNGHAYDVWRTIYLPLSFVITGLFGDPTCYANAPYDARDCDVFGIVFILMMYVACVGVTIAAFRRADRSTYIYRSIAIAIGGPLLYALERGQLIMLTYVAFVLLYGNLVRARGWFAGVAGFMANTKVYMVFPFLALALRREWRLLELCLLGTLAIYLVSLLIVGAGTPFEMISNLQNWFGVRLGTVWDEMLYTTTYKPLLQLDVYQYPVRDYIEQRYVDAAIVFINGYVIASRLVAWLCIGLAWLYPRAVSHSRLVFFILMQSFIGQNPGGYSIALIVFLVFLERADGRAAIVAVVCAYLISVPGDWTLVKLTDVEREAWLSGRTVMSEYVVPWGALIRPAIIAIMMWALAIDSLRALHRAIKAGPPLWGLMPRSNRGLAPVPA
jgi:hypothetical protein